PQRLGDHPAVDRLDAGGQGFHVVGEVGQQAVRTFVVKVREVEVDDVPVKAIADVEERQVGDAADQRFLEELENAFECDAGHGPGEKPNQAFKAVFRQVTDDEPFQ